MPLNKSTGNMYDWVSHTHTHLGGACPHACTYCSVNALKKYPEVASKYSGPLRLIEKELEIRYGSGKEIFVENLNDLWAESVPSDYIRRVLNHCRQWPENLYIFQTKNPARYLNFEPEFPINVNIGCTIETNWETASLSKAPAPAMRVPAMQYLARRFKTFVTVEPILDFDLAEFLAMLVSIRPAFVNVGADSKGHKLPEPIARDVRDLIAGLLAEGIEVRGKHNLARILKEGI
jgi:DNA repair photolyase